MINPGTMLGDRYEIIELIGTGGMADVYKAKCHKLNRFVAIKVLKPEFSSNKSFVSKFKVEAQSAAGLVHSNIVNVYDVGDENGLYYFVMELVEGRTLKKYIEKKIRLSYKEAVSIAILVSLGIEAAHNNGIVHRDIKPQNIIISDEGKVKVADFGIARAATSDTITSHAMGSVHYTSPEQARGGYSDQKSDIYSIGISLFEMVTGRVPFDGETTVAIAIKHIQEEMPSPRIYVPDLPLSVEQIILKCTQKNPDRRYANMAELIADLKHALKAPDDDFVVIGQGASNEGTKVIKESERMEIKNRTEAKNAQNLQGGPVPGAKRPMGNRPDAMPNNPDYQQNYAPNPNQEYYGGQGGYPNGYPGQNMGYNNSNQDYYGGYGANNFKQSGSVPPGYNQGYPNNMGQAEYDNMGYGNEYEDEEEYFQPRQTAIPDLKRNSRGRKIEDDRDIERGKSKKSSKRDKYADYDNDYEENVAPGMEKVITGLVVAVAIIIAIVAIFFVGKLLGFFDLPMGSDMEVPNFVGLTVEEGNEIVKELGLNNVVATTAPSTEYEANYIISQSPEEGTEIDEDTKIELVVSSGKVESSEDEETGEEENTEESQPEEGKINVPDVVGMTEAEAKVKLENEEFVVVKEYEESPSVEKGNVISQSPLAATNAARKSEVTIVVSSGKTEVEVTVPDLTGKDEDAAKAALEAAGLTCTSTMEENSNTVSAGYVCRQSIEAGAKVLEGANVDLWISLGPAGYKCSYSINAPANYLPGTDAIVVLMNASGAEIARASTASFPYNFEKTGIVGSTSGYISVTYLNSDAQWETTAMVPVTFTEGGN